MNAPRTAGGRALVLGGGGSTGNAWLIGILAGLSDAGLDVTAADLTIGTSAGSTAAAQLAGATPTELFQATLVATSGQRSLPLGADRRSAPTGGVPAHLDKTNKIIALAENPADMRRRMGRAALEMDVGSDDDWQTPWRATVAGRLTNQRWPQRALLIPAVDASSGEPVVFDRQSGVELVDAVAASCSSARPYRIGDRYYIDGGYRRNENADLAAGQGQVLVLSPFGGRSRHPQQWGMHLAAQIAELRAGGSSVEHIFPDNDFEQLFGARAMDLSLRPAAARAGYDQGRTHAEQLTDFWH